MLKLSKPFPLLILVFLLTNCDTPIVDSQQALQKNETALQYLNKGNYNNAILNFKEALKAGSLTDETKQIILRNIAISYYDNSQVDSSIYYFKKAIDISPKETYEYFVNLAEVDLLVDRVDDAITNLKRARSLDPEKLEVNNTLGLIFLGEYGEQYIDYKRALHYNEKVEKISSDRTTKSVLARNYYYLKDYKKAETLFAELKETHPSLLDYQYWYGITKYEMGAIDSAEIVLNDLISKDSSYNSLLDFLEN